MLTCVAPVHTYFFLCLCLTYFFLCLCLYLCRLGSHVLFLMLMLASSWFTRTFSYACAYTCVVSVHTYFFLYLCRPGSHVLFLMLVLILVSSRFTRTFSCAYTCVVSVHTYFFLCLCLLLRLCLRRTCEPAFSPSLEQNKKG